MHPTCLDWVQRTLTAEHVKGRSVLEVGSYDVNGTVRPYIESLQPSRYLGVDVAAGPCVDQVVDCELLTVEVGYGVWDVVISTEMLEHVRDWRGCMINLACAAKPGGLLLVTTRSPGFGYHPFPEDHWRFTSEQMRRILEALRLEVMAVEDDPVPGVLALARRGLIVGGLAGLKDIEVAAVDG